MFHQARIKLTLWYLLIIMLISAAFSIVIYRALTNEIDRVERLQRTRLQRLHDLGFFIFDPSQNQNQGPNVFYDIDPDLISETKNRILIVLLGINGGILILSSLAGYMLAGRTLQPIQEMTEEQDRFIADASHELRTPITAMRTELEVSMMDKKLQLSEAKHLLASNLEEVIHLQDLTDRLLVLTRQEHPANLKKEKVSLRKIIDNALRSTQPAAKLKHIVIEDTVSDFALFGDEHRFIELFTILLDNAVKYSHENSSIILQSKKIDHHVQVAVTDTGIGISKKDLPHIFERFYRADTSRTKSETKGFGLGLSIAQEIVDLYDGEITAESTLGKGSTFTVILPITKKT